MKRYAFLALILFAFLAGCSSVKVVVDYDDQFNFSQYKTFHFVPPKDVQDKQMAKPAVIRDPLFVKQTGREISAVLTQKGFREAAEAEQADFLIAFYATAKNKAQITPPTYHIGRFGRRWVTPGHVYHYKQGTLIIDIVDRGKHELVWRGVGTGVLDRSDPGKNLLAAVEKVMEKFPPKQ
ncbi:MAG: DUF4136 domain-containing protein [Candidatus Zhuqueibacterota bacterium]